MFTIARLRRRPHAQHAAQNTTHASSAQITSLGEKDIKPKHCRSLSRCAVAAVAAVCCCGNYYRHTVQTAARTGDCAARPHTPTTVAQHGSLLAGKSLLQGWPSCLVCLGVQFFVLYSATSPFRGRRYDRQRMCRARGKRTVRFSAASRVCRLFRLVMLRLCRAQNGAIGCCGPLSGKQRLASDSLVKYRMCLSNKNSR